MNVKLINTLNEIKASEWNHVVGDSYPFIRYEFLSALEDSGAASMETGWLAQHLLVYQADQLVACMPLYLKTHSRGEYVFDQQWSQAYARYGHEYYPKWVTSIPFTPCQNKRIYMLADVDARQVFSLILDFLKANATTYHVSSWHCLFAEQQQAQLLKQFNISIRQDVQFHWHNREYASFEDFTGRFNARYRKKIKRERRKTKEMGITFQHLSGKTITEQQLHVFVQFYNMTYGKKGMYAYLNKTFFKKIITSMPEQLLFVFAQQEQRYIGAALSFIGNETLYGRHWGCLQEFDSLHFETCYYQGIDYCIEHKLKLFDAGAQGEHKIARGFEPVTTYSAHWIHHPEFAKAVSNFLQRETTLVEQYKQDIKTNLPFKKN